MVWDWGKYLNSKIQEIEEMKNEGYTEREILDKNTFPYEALKACGLPISYLVPKIEGRELTLQEWDTHTSSGHKWEYYNGSPFGQEDERDRVMLGLIYTAGLKHLLEILPDESRMELYKLVKQKSDME